MHNWSPDDMIAHAQRCLTESDVAGAAAYASLASVELLREFVALARAAGADEAQEPAWQEGDLVRHRARYGTPIGEHEADLVALLQSKSALGMFWWEATVLRTDPLTAHIVGQGIRLLEGDKNNAVARFPE